MRALKATALASLLGYPLAAHASPTARLVYSRTTEAASCPDEAALRAAVAKRVGYDAFFPWATRTIVAAVVRRGEAFVATVDLVDENGIDHGGHELHTEGACSDLLDAVALAVAITIDPRSAVAVPPAVPDPPPDVPPLEAMPLVGILPQAAPPPRPVAPETDPVHVDGSVGLSGLLGVVPSVAVAGDLGVALRWRWLSLGLEALVSAPASTGGPHGSSVSAWVAAGSLLPCVHLGLAFLCGEAQAGALESSAPGVTGARTASNTLGAVGGRAGILIHVTDAVLLRARTDLLVNLSPTTIEVEGRQVWSAPAVAGVLGIDAVLRFR